jgi:hypothetical protein
MLYRVSTLIEDNTATGTERVLRELAATLLNPALGFNRLVQMNDITANPPSWRPTAWGAIDVGYQNLSGSDTQEEPRRASRNQGVFAFRLDGDGIEDLGKSPFSSFHVEADVNSNTAPKHHLSNLRAVGSLARSRCPNPQVRTTSWPSS